jgi:hypothetical protein
VASQSTISLNLLSVQQEAGNGQLVASNGSGSNRDQFGDALNSELNKSNKPELNQLVESNINSYDRAEEIPEAGSGRDVLASPEVANTGQGPPADLAGLMNLLQGAAVNSGQNLPGVGKSLPLAIGDAGFGRTINPNGASGSLTSLSSQGRSMIDPTRVTNVAGAADNGSLRDGSVPSANQFLDPASGHYRQLGPQELLDLQAARVGENRGSNRGHMLQSGEVTGLVPALLTRKFTQPVGLDVSNLAPGKELSLPASSSSTQNLHQLLSRLSLAESKSDARFTGKADLANTIQEGRWLASGASGRQVFIAQLAASADDVPGQVEAKPLSVSASPASTYSLSMPGVNSPLAKEAAGPVLQTVMASQLGQPAWEAELGQQARMMIQENVKLAEIALKPARLGTIEILVTQEKEHTSLMFFTKNPLVREALEAGLARLQKSFSEDGLNLENTQVSDQSLSEHREQQRQASQRHQLADNQGQSQLDELSSLPANSEQALTSLPTSMLDTWA